MKWIFRGIVLIFLVVVVAGVSVFFIPADRVARIATEQLRAVTGRDVRINGEVTLTFWPVLGAKVGGLEVDNAEWAEQGPMLQAASAAIGVDVRALLGGDVRITNIEAVSPTIRLEQRADGRASWQFTDASGTAQIETGTAPDQPTRALSIEKMTVTDATLIYDAEGSDVISYGGVDLSLDWPEPTGPAKIAATLSPTSNAVQVSAVIDGFADFIAGSTQAVQASITAADGALVFDGRASTAGAVAGALTIKSDDTGAFLGALGVPGVDLPENLGRRIDLSTGVTLTPDRQLALRDLSVGLGSNHLAGAADITLNGVPQVNMQLDLGKFDLTTEPSQTTAPSQQATGSSGGGDAASSSGWSQAPIDASALAAFDGEIALSAQTIDLGQFKLGATQALLRNEQSRMVFELRDVAAYGGAVTGEVVINNRSGLSVGGKLNAQAIQMQFLLDDAAGIDRLTGLGDARVSFLGVGGSLDAIMRSLSGDGSLQIGRGTIVGIDLDRLMRSGDSSGGTTVFDSLGGSWSIADGVLSNSDLALQLKNYRATGKGVVGLGTQTLDYTVTPIALRANSGQGVSIPVRFVGPWSNVSIRPDLEAAFDAELDAQVDALEDAAKAKIEEKLGIPAQDGQSTEDAIKEKLLKRLFD